VVYRDIQQSNLIVGWRAFPAFHPRHFVGELLNVVLGRGWSSRLYIKVREEMGLCYVIGAGSDTYTDVGNFLVRTGTDPGKATQALAAIVDECRMVKEKKVGAKEMKKVKEYWKGKMILAMEDIEFLANNVGMQELMFDKVISPEEMMKKIEEVTAEDIKRLAQEIFVTEKMNLAVVGPFKEDAEFKKLMRV
jgi:predicted Zn-dependent peptidase